MKKFGICTAIILCGFVFIVLGTVSTNPSIFYLLSAFYFIVALLESGLLNKYIKK